MTQRTPGKILLAVIRALFLRELNSKMSVGKLGLFWTFFQPFAQVSIFILIRVLITGSVQGANYDIAVFMASGFIAFNMFRDTLTGSAGAFTANKGILIYKQVKPIDTLIARVLENVFITGIIILAFVFIAFFFHYDFVPQNFLMVSLGYLWLLIFSFGIGLIVAVGSTFSTSIGKVIGIMSMALMLTSGIFYSLIDIPQEYREILLYNPVLHFIEMIHGYYIYPLDDRFVDYNYMLLWTIIPLFMGSWLYTRLEKRIISA